PIDDNDEFSQANDARYKDLGSDMPKTECLKDVVNRLLPYLNNEIAIDLRAGKTVLVAAHGNSIRAIVKHIACISDEEIAEVNIPTGIPLLFNFDDDFEPLVKRGEYLDPEAAQAAIEAVANQGKK
ncbi:MAG: 2,3-bisphosphoglycerate-dependent phosphoglycerate mutase, partial [Actinomycetota bacterium]